MKERVKLAIVGIVMAVFVLFLAFFAIYEDNLVGNGQQDQNISNATGNMELPFIENMLHNQDSLNMANIMLTKENIMSYLTVKAMISSGSGRY